MTEERGEYIRFLNGEVLVFKHFFKEHFPKFFAFTSRFIDDSYVREDIVQETFFEVYRKREELMKHPNIRYTEDGGAGPFNYAKAPLAHDDFTFDETRYDDYELLLDEVDICTITSMNWIVYSF